MLHSAIKANKKYYPQILLEECRYEIRKKKIKSLVDDDDDFGSSLSDKSDNEPDSEPDNESEHESDNESNNEHKNHFKKFDDESKNLFKKSNHQFDN